jgi:hypothetical protein
MKFYECPECGNGTIVGPRPLKIAHDCPVAGAYVELLPGKMFSEPVTPEDEPTHK